MNLTLVNEYILDLDLKYTYSDRMPKFRTGDSGVLIFRIFDDGIEYDLSEATKAKLYQRTNCGTVIESECTFTMLDGKRVIRYDYETIAMAEAGFNTLVLTIENNNEVVSIQPFRVLIYDIGGQSSSYLNLIQDLSNIIENLTLDLEDVVKLTDKGVANGVATLDNNGKIPTSQFPIAMDAFIRHIPETVYEHQVHGLRIDEGYLQYETQSNVWQNVGFAPEAMTGDSQFLNATVAVENGLATLTYYGNPNVTNQKWDAGERVPSYFVDGGNVITGNTFNVTRSGVHTLWYQDDLDNTYSLFFTVQGSELAPLTIETEVVNGVVTVTLSRSYKSRKWQTGIRDIAYFQTNGNIIEVPSNTFTVTTIGMYSLYVKDSYDVEYVHTFFVSEDMLRHDPPVISVSISNAVVTVTRTPDYPVVVSKYTTSNDSAQTVIEYGSNFTNNTFNVSQIGYHTVYEKYANGNEATLTFIVTDSDLASLSNTQFISASLSYVNDSDDRYVTYFRVKNDDGISQVRNPDGITRDVGGVTTFSELLYDVPLNVARTYRFIIVDTNGYNKFLDYILDGTGRASYNFNDELTGLIR